MGFLFIAFSVGYPAALAGQVPTSLNPIHIDKRLLVSTSPSDELPLRIVIPSINIDLPITPSRVVEGYWELSDTTASYGMGSSYPGENGNVVVFAHARKGLFLPLRDIQKNTPVYIFTKSHWYEYTVVDMKSVDPSNVSVIAPTTSPTLTLFTCSGFVDEKRLIVTAKPSESVLPQPVTSSH